jgi:hypothetical protein
LVINKEYSEMGKFIQTNKFKTIGDDGLFYNVIEFAEFQHTSKHLFPSGDALGIRQYELEDGSVVNRLSATEFQILISDIKLKLY